MSKRSGSSPQGLRRDSRLPGQQSRSQVARTGGVQRTPLAHDHTGAFGSFRKPKLVGVSDVVRVANRDSGRAARRAEKTWMRNLSAAEKRYLLKGV